MPIGEETPTWQSVAVSQKGHFILILSLDSQGKPSEDEPSNYGLIYTLHTPRNKRLDRDIFWTFYKLSCPLLTSPCCTGYKVQVSLFFAPGGSKPEISPPLMHPPLSCSEEPHSPQRPITCTIKQHS